MRLPGTTAAACAVLFGSGLTVFSTSLSTSRHLQLLCAALGLLGTVLVAISAFRHNDRRLILAMALYVICFVLSNVRQQHSVEASAGYALMLFVTAECAYGAARRGPRLAWQSLQDRGRLVYLATVIASTIAVDGLSYEFALKGRQGIGVEAFGVIGLLLVPVVLGVLGRIGRRDPKALRPRS